MRLQGVKKWGMFEAETAWLHRAGFTRRNTREAILDFLRNGLWPEERILHLTSGTYRLQMGFLAITDRRVVFGMYWAFFPFLKRRFAVPHEQIAWVRMDSKPWGARLILDSPLGRGALGNLQENEAARLAGLVAALSQRAKRAAWARAAQDSPGSGGPAPGGPANPGPRADSSPSGSLPSRPT